MSALGFIKELFAGDVKKVKDYIYHDVLIPTTKKLLWDMGSGSLHAIIYENPSTGAPNNSSGFGMKYWSGSQPPARNPERGSQPYTITPMAKEYSPQQAKQQVGMVGGGGGTKFDNLTFATKSQAVDIIDRLKEKLAIKSARGENGIYVTVADMLNEYQRIFEGEVRIQSDFTCQDYGWANLDEARAASNEVGWHVVWPEPVAIATLIKR